MTSDFDELRIEYDKAIEKHAPGMSFSYDTCGFIFRAGFDLAMDKCIGIDFRELNVQQGSTILDLSRKLDECANKYLEVSKKYSRLVDKIINAEEVLSFYQDKDSWNYSSGTMSEINTGDWYTYPFEKELGRLVWVGGKRAREYFKKWGKCE